MIDGTEKAKLVAIINAAKVGASSLKKVDMSPENLAKINQYFAEQQKNSISKVRDYFKADIQEMHSAGVAGRKVASTEVLLEKSPDGDKVTIYKDANGNVIYEKREAHNGSREKVTYYGTNGQPTTGYNIYTDGKISGFQALEYNNGKEEVLWQTK